MAKFIAIQDKDKDKGMINLDSVCRIWVEPVSFMFPNNPDLYESVVREWDLCILFLGEVGRFPPTKYRYYYHGNKDAFFDFESALHKACDIDSDYFDILGINQEGNDSE